MIDQELTAARRSADANAALLADYQLFHIEADLRWIDHAGSTTPPAGSAPWLGRRHEHAGRRPVAGA